MKASEAKMLKCGLNLPKIDGERERIDPHFQYGGALQAQSMG